MRKEKHPAFRYLLPQRGRGVFEVGVTIRKRGDRLICNGQSMAYVSSYHPVNPSMN